MMFAEFRQGNFDLLRWRSLIGYRGMGKNSGCVSSSAPEAMKRFLPWRNHGFSIEGWLQVSNCFARNPIITVPITMNCGPVSNCISESVCSNWSKAVCSIGWRGVVIDDLSPSPPRPSFIQEEDLSISKLGFSLTRDTRDSILFPSEGSIVTLRKEFAGGPFGGDADYGRFELQGARFPDLRCDGTGCYGQWPDGHLGSV